MYAADTYTGILGDGIRGRLPWGGRIGTRMRCIVTHGQPGAQSGIGWEGVILELGMEEGRVGGKSEPEHPGTHTEGMKGIQG